MDKQLEAVLASLKQAIRLTPEERDACRLALQARMASESVRATPEACQSDRMPTPSSPLRALKRSVRLSTDELGDARAAVMSFVRGRPVKGTAERPERFFLIPLRTMPVLALIVVILVGAGGVSTYAADSALPGDALYPVKVYIAEPLRSSFAFGADAQARVDTKHAERRLEEAAVLAAAGRLSDETRVQVGMLFDEQFARVQEHLSALAVTDNAAAADLSARFEGALTAHAAVLNELSIDGDGTNLNVLVESVQHAKVAANQARAATHAKVGVMAQDAQDESLEFAKQKLQSLGDELQRRARKAGDDTVAKVQAKIDAANKAIFTVETRSDGDIKVYTINKEEQKTEHNGNGQTTTKQSVKVNVRTNGDTKPSVTINGVPQVFQNTSSSSVRSSSSPASQSQTSTTTTSNGSTTHIESQSNVQVESHVNTNTSTNVQVNDSASVQVHDSVNVHVGD